MLLFYYFAYAFNIHIPYAKMFPVPLAIHNNTKVKTR